MRAASIPVRSLPSSYPKPIERTLGRLHRRVFIARLASGLGVTALLAAIVCALGMAADFLWALPVAGRWVSLGATLAAILITFGLTVVRGMVRRPGAFDLAAVAERAHQEVGEVLTGAVALRQAHSHGSPALIAAVAERAAERVAAIESARVIPWRRPVRLLAIGAFALSTFLAPILVWPETYGRLARHFLMPWADVERPGRHVIDVSPGDCAAAVGSDLQVSASVRARLAFDPVPGEAWLDWSAPGERAIHRVAIPLAPEDNSSGGSVSHQKGHHYSIVLPSLSRSIVYQIQSGSVKSPRYAVTVVEPPSLNGLRARVEPPAYTKLPAATASDSSRIEAFEGSRVTLDIKASRALRSIAVEWPVGAADDESAKSEKVAARMAAGGGSGTLSVEATRSGPFRVELRDELGIASRADLPRRVIVRPDAAPVLAMRGPENASDATANDTVSLGIAARDDIAISSVQLHYAIERKESAASDGETGHIDVALPGLNSRVARGSAALALGRLAVKPGDVVSYRVRVADNRPAPKGPNVVWSEAQTIQIVAKAEPLRVRASRARASGLHARLDSLRKDVAADRQKTEALRQDAIVARRGDQEWNEEQRAAVEEREAATRAIGEQLKLLSRDLERDARQPELAREARQIAEVEAEAARSKIEQAAREPRAAEREAALERAVGRLGAVNERLDDLTRRFEAKAREAAETNRLGELAGREEELAAMAGEAAGDRASSDRVTAEQEAVRNELDDLLRKTPPLKGLVLSGEIREAERLAGQVRALAERERMEAQRVAEPSKQTARLKELAELQRELEDDARQLGVVVNQPLSENGRSHVDAEAIRQGIEPIERGDFEAGRTQLDRAEFLLRRLAWDIAGLQDDPKALAIRLFRRQDALNQEIDHALRPFAGRQVTSEEKAGLDAKLKPLMARQRAIAELAGTIKPPLGQEARARFPQDAARDAAAKTKRLAETIASRNADEITNRKNEARQALERLANELPDVWRRREPMRQRFEEARRLSHEVANEIAQNIHETDPRPDRPATTDGAAEELARRLGGTADKQARAVAALEALEPEADSAPQHERAVRRAQKLRAVLKDLRDPSKRVEARASLQAAEAEARAAIERLGQKLGGYMPSDDIARELSDEAKRASDSVAAKKQAIDDAERARAANNQRALAGAIRSLTAHDDPAAKEEAVRAAERAARALEASDKSGTAPDLAGLMAASAAAAQALADRLADRQQRKDDAQPEESSNVAKPTKGPIVAKPAPVAEPELALKPEHGDRALELARRQRRIKEGFQSLLGERAAHQQAIRGESVALGRQLGVLRDRMRHLSDPAWPVANQAADHLVDFAPQAVDQAINQLAGAQMQSARNEERRAASLLARGAELAEDVAAALRADIANSQGAMTPSGDADHGRAAEAIGDARDQMRQAAQGLEAARSPARAPEAGAEARQAMLRAARDLQTAAELAGAIPAPDLGSPGEGGQDLAAEGADGEGHADAQTAGSTRDPKSAPGARGEADLTELKALVRQKTGRSWGELPAHLRNEIVKMQAGRYREDYARIIQLYFREIAADSGARENAKP